MIYLLTFVFTLHITPTTYINSSFLEEFVGTKNVGFVYATASILTILAFFYIRKFLKKIGNYKTFLSLLIIETTTLLIMAFTGTAVIAVIAYVIGFTTRSIAFFSLDIFLESATKDSDTGGTRGIYMTALNTAFIMGPFISSFVLTNGDYWKIYSIAAILQIPVFFVLIKYMKGFKDPIYQKPKFLKALNEIRKNNDMYSTFMSGFLLRFFFAWMIIYIPIYLHTNIGFSLSDTTLILAIALIPFVLLEAILGKVADEKLGEKELLTTGFIIMALSTMLIPFINSSNLLVWASLLFVTRIGASMVEIMSETHFFKRIDSSNVNLLSLYRTSRPVAYIAATLTGSLFIAIMDFRYLFLVLGVILLYGIRYSLTIRDTK